MLCSLLEFGNKYTKIVYFDFSQLGLWLDLDSRALLNVIATTLIGH